MKTQVKKTASLVGRTLNYKLYGMRGDAIGFYSLISEESGVVSEHTADDHVTFGRNYSVALPNGAADELEEFGIYRISFPDRNGMLRVEIRID